MRHTVNDAHAGDLLRIRRLAEGEGPQMGQVETSDLELICFPPAGGSAATFRSWQTVFGPGLSVRVMDRRTRPAGERRGAALTDLAAEMAALIPGCRDYALVGHSLGGLLAYETAARICRNPRLRRPRFVLVAGSRPPHRSSAEVFAPLLRLSDDALLDALAGMGALSSALRETPLRALFTPGLRADLALIAGYRPDLTAPPLPVDLLAWHGTEDALATPELGLEWARYTSARFTHLAFSGGHFFPVEQVSELASALRAYLSAR